MHIQLGAQCKPEQFNLRQGNSNQDASLCMPVREQSVSVTEETSPGIVCFLRLSLSSLHLLSVPGSIGMTGKERSPVSIGALVGAGRVSARQLGIQADRGGRGRGNRLISVEGARPP